MPILHGADLSPFVRKVRFTLALKGVEYESNPVVPFIKTEEFLRISPLGKIPVYEEEGFPIPDSSVIIDYLERTHPTPSLYPADPRDRAQALFYEEYSDTKLTEILGAPFFQRFIRPRFMQQEPDHELVEEVLTEKLPDVFDYLEESIGDGPYLMGSELSIADVAVASPFVNFFISGEAVDAGRWPRLADYVGRLHSVPEWKPIVDSDLSARDA